MVQRRGARAGREGQPRTAPTPAPVPGGARRATRGARRRAPRRLPWRAATALIAVLVLGIGTFVVFNEKGGGVAEASIPSAPLVSETASTMLRVKWHPVAGSDHYEVLIRPAGSDAEGEVVTLTADTTEVQVPRLAANATYEIGVRSVREAEAKDGTTTERSDVSPWTPSTTAADKDPELLVPRDLRAESVEPQVITGSWERIDSAEGYEVQISRHDDFRDPRTITVDEPTVRATGLFGGVDYRMRVRAISGESAGSKFTDGVTIRTLTPEETPPIRVSTFNVQCHKCAGPSWKSRRGNVAATIAQQAPDVIGLQEALEHGPGGVAQYEDLRRLIAGQGVEYAVTDTGRAAKGVRIFYRSDRLTVSSVGTHTFANQKRGAPVRQAAWAIFTQRSTSKSFLFVSLHLEPNDKGVKLRQAQEIARLVPQWADGKPAVVVGDFNASQFSQYSVHQAMHHVGLIHPLGLRASSRSASGVVAESLVHANRDSFNYGRTAPPAAGRGALGSYIDNIFTTKMRILEFENVARVGSNGRFLGPTSDHNMLRADIVLP